ncbi:MAG: xerS [Paenibacillus sp.]|nr:xerS [Paenibacillus sp.]
MINNKAPLIAAYFKNKERDLALISLILTSGLRISEALSLVLDNIDWLICTVKVTRKGGNKDLVTVSDIGMDDLKEYIAIVE